MFQKVIGQKSNDSLPIAPPAPPAPSSFEHAAAPASVAPASVAPRSTAGATRNVLATDVEIKGTLKFTNDLIVDGRIEGEIHSDGNLTIGENARLKAEIRTATVTVHGKVHGNITALERVDLKAGAEVVGDIKAKVLTMEAGAILVGKTTIGTPTSTPAANNNSSNNNTNAPKAATSAVTSDKALV